MKIKVIIFISCCKLIQIHPLALIHPERVLSKVTTDKINKLTAGYENKSDYFHILL